MGATVPLSVYQTIYDLKRFSKCRSVVPIAHAVHVSDHGTKPRDFANSATCAVLTLVHVAACGFLSARV